MRGNVKKGLLLGLALFLSSSAFAGTEPASGAVGRFTRDADGVITDSHTNLQWLEGPDRETSWNDAQAWISGLGHGWRTPTRAELQGIYLEESTREVPREGKKETFPLHLDSAFHLETAWWVWAETKDASSGWGLGSGTGYDTWDTRDVAGSNRRAFAVRSR